MCLAIPARVERIAADGETATVVVGEVSKNISLALIDDIRIGDYVLIHVGYALSVISPDEARKTLALFAEAGHVAGAGEQE
jgi:hydrogenase expression/formation protein HypC